MKGDVQAYIFWVYKYVPPCSWSSSSLFNPKVFTTLIGHIQLHLPNVQPYVTSIINFVTHLFTNEIKFSEKGCMSVHIKHALAYLFTNFTLPAQ